MSEVIPMKKRNPKRKVPKTRIDLHKIEMLSMQRLSLRQMASILEIPIEEFRAEMGINPKIRESMERGKAKVISNCAGIVLKAIKGEPVSPEQLESARFYLDRHSPDWKERD